MSDTDQLTLAVSMVGLTIAVSFVTLTITLGRIADAIRHHTRMSEMGAQVDRSAFGKTVAQFIATRIPNAGDVAHVDDVTIKNVSRIPGSLATFETSAQVAEPPQQPEDFGPV